MENVSLLISLFITPIFSRAEHSPTRRFIEGPCLILFLRITLWHHSKPDAMPRATAAFVESKLLSIGACYAVHHRVRWPAHTNTKYKLTVLQWQVCFIISNHIPLILFILLAACLPPPSFHVGNKGRWWKTDCVRRSDNVNQPIISLSLFYRLRLIHDEMSLPMLHPRLRFRSLVARKRSASSFHHLSRN